MNAMTALIARLRKALRRPAFPAVSASAAAPPASPTSKAASGRAWLGIGFILTVLLMLGFLAGVDLQSQVKLFFEGEIASQDVAATMDLRIEDREATLRRRAQVAENQPPVFDLNPAAFETLRKNVFDVLDRVRSGSDDLERLRWEVSEELNTEISKDTVVVWRQADFADQLADQAMSWLKTAYADGVVARKSALGALKNGMIVRDLASGMETIRANFEGVNDIESLKEGLEQLLKRDLKKNLRTRKAVNTLVGAFVEPDLTLNQTLTQSRQAEAVASVEPILHQIKKGEIIVRQGERVSQEEQRQLQMLSNSSGKHLQYVRALGIFGVEFLFLFGLHLAFIKKRGLWWLSDRDWLFMGTVLLIFALGAKTLDMARHSLWEYPALRLAGYPSFMLPVAGAAGVLALFFPKTICFFMTMLLSFAAAYIGGGGLPLFSFYFIGGMSYTFLIKRSETRAEFMNSIFPLAAIFVLLTIALHMIDYRGVEALGGGLAMALANALFCQLCGLGLSPMLEIVFGYTSRFRLMELLNLEQPLLQRLMVEAPGTYHHSLIVSNMVEAGARAIGANALLAKVAALYHDIGKLKNPQYFIENQVGRENKHDKLTPAMSALILISHAKKGMEMALEYKLGPEIADLIRQHHGATLIAYFYHKAQELAEAKGEDPVAESEFRYPGPKPQTKEAGLILIADAIEASARTLVEPTPSRIKGHIENIIRKVFTEGELDESELTFKDLNQLSGTFHRILTGIFHHRVEYPREQAKNGKPAKDAKAAAPPDPAPADAAPKDEAPRNAGKQTPATAPIAALALAKPKAAAG
ncbi:MAG: HDIG domain-containing protein [Desulfovibrionaceae bacterium]|nr:HDIG domain-containing protein [Desulfovibrionaceae bacterium]MBF0514888.1 HDIG domain-containing protein [Desulfovibrionaceae bacterium]